MIRREWLAPGTHVNSVGLNPQGREIDQRTLDAASVFVESRASSLAPPPAGAPDLLGVDPAHVTELGEIVLREHPGRSGQDELTLYKSVGVAVEDAVAAALVLKAARESGVGLEIELEEL